MRSGVCALLAASGLAVGLTAGCREGRDTEPAATEPTVTYHGGLSGDHT
jgi:hypothetical protein